MFINILKKFVKRTGDFYDDIVAEFFIHRVYYNPDEKKTKDALDRLIQISLMEAVAYDDDMIYRIYMAIVFAEEMKGIICDYKKGIEDLHSTTLDRAKRGVWAAHIRATGSKKEWDWIESKNKLPDWYMPKNT